MASVLCTRATLLQREAWSHRPVLHPSDSSHHSDLVSAHPIAPQKLLLPRSLLTTHLPTQQTLQFSWYLTSVGQDTPILPPYQLSPFLAIFLSIASVSAGILFIFWKVKYWPSKTSFLVPFLCNDTHSPWVASSTPCLKLPNIY